MRAAHMVVGVLLAKQRGTQQQVSEQRSHVRCALLVHHSAPWLPHRLRSRRHLGQVSMHVRFLATRSMRRPYELVTGAILRH